MKDKDVQSQTSPEILMLGFLCVKGSDSLDEKVGILDRFALSVNDISRICAAAPQSVRNARAKRKKSV